MRLGISVGHKDLDFFGFSRYKNGQYFEADFPITPHVERAIELTKPIWSAKYDVPVVFIDEGDHGFDRGLILKEGVCDYQEEDAFVRSELAVRISFGAKALKERLDYSDGSRLHISVSGKRQIFPEDWKAVPTSDYRDKVELTPVIECVHVSLRWLSGKYDDWDDADVWKNELDSKLLGRKRFHEGRTTYCSASPHEFETRSGSKADEESVVKFLQKEGRKGAAIPIGPALKYGRFDSHEAEPSERIYDGGIGHRIPIIGYDNVQSCLSESLPFKPQAEIRKMTEAEGVDFLFNGVLPGLQRFITK